MLFSADIGVLGDTGSQSGHEQRCSPAGADGEEKTVGAGGNPAEAAQ